MAIHGEFVSDGRRNIRVVRGDGDEVVRVFFHEDVYQYLQPLYEYAEWIAAGVSIEEVPPRINSCFEWLSSLTWEIGAYGWMFSVAIIGWVAHLAKNQISIGKFTYKSVGWGEGRWGEMPWGAGDKILELPVEG